MKNQMFIPTASQLKVLEKEKVKHQKMLNEIQGQDRKTKVVEKNLAIGFKISQTRQKNLQAIHKGKEKVIEEENEMLLGKLVEISRKKANFVVRSESATALKSLNAPYKKREMARISSENETFARRLISQQSTFDRRKLDVEYKKHKELVLHMKRITATPGKNVKKLPPLKNESQITPKVGSAVLKQSELAQSVVKEDGDTQRTKPQDPVAISTVGNEEDKKTEPPMSKRNSQVDSNVVANTQGNVAETKPAGNTNEENKPNENNNEEKKPEQAK